MPIDYKISCKKLDCLFEIIWEDPPDLEYVKNHFWGYNEYHKESMQCIHDYEFIVIRDDKN